MYLHFFWEEGAIKKTEMFSLKDPFAWEFFACPHFKSDICKDKRRSHVKLDNILFYFFKKEEMKRDENETLCWIMRWGWMTWKRSLAFNNNDGKNNQQIYLQKKLKNKNFNLLPIPPVSFGPCPRNIPWNENQKIRAIFQLLTRSAFGNLLTDFNMHWLHSEI